MHLENILKGECMLMATFNLNSWIESLLWHFFVFHKDPCFHSRHHGNTLATPARTPWTVCAARSLKENLQLIAEQTATKEGGQQDSPEKDCWQKGMGSTCVLKLQKKTKKWLIHKIMVMCGVSRVSRGATLCRRNATDKKTKVCVAMGPFGTRNSFHLTCQSVLGSSWLCLLFSPRWKGDVGNGTFCQLTFGHVSGTCRTAGSRGRGSSAAGASSQHVPGLP